MSRTLRKQLFQALDTLRKANEYIEKLIADKRQNELANLLLDCQDCAIAIGSKIEKLYGENTQAIHSLEAYCETIYLISQNEVECVENKQLIAQTRIQLLETQAYMEQEIPDRIEAVFLPYKAAMWDSLESVWLAARDDVECDAYVIPIPYYDRNQDGSFGEMHYEGDEYPDYVPITAWTSYDLEERKPDIVYIHNPYDDANIVTSVHPDYYSKELKKNANKLVYIPYYATSGGMSEGQRMCSAYRYVDYIVIQAPKYRDYFDASIPDEKFLALGSPKFDRVIHKCQNPPEPPEEWKLKITGKKVYFYNTSIGGMLENTEDFLKKMEYVFSCFKGRKDACLLWRPHPLLESTFESMRAAYKPIYDMLKSMFFKENIGIYDTTPDIADTIALCDAYIGDSATSVTALFGIAGKPLFILNNHIHSEPTEEDRRREIVPDFNVREVDDRWIITQGNQLYYSKKNNYHYEFCCSLSDNSEKNYYSSCYTVGDKTYVCPSNAQDIIVIEKGKIRKRIELERQTEKSTAFAYSIRCERYIFLIPGNYPALVQIDTTNDNVKLYTEKINVFSCWEQGELKVGSPCKYKDCLFIPSPINNYVYCLQYTTGKVTILTVGGTLKCGSLGMMVDGNYIWMLPYDKLILKRWNPETGETIEYSVFPKGFKCKNPVAGYECSEFPFSNGAIVGDNIYLSPLWGNMYLLLNKKSGKIQEWKSDFPQSQTNDKQLTVGNGYFLRKGSEKFSEEYQYYRVEDHRLFNVNMKTGQWVETPIIFNQNEIESHEAGFSRISDWLKYGCHESAFNSLNSFLDGKIVGNVFRKSKQLCSYQEIVENNDGTCGKKVHLYIVSNLTEKNGKV